MTELYGLADIGATQTRVTLMDEHMITRGVDYSRTDPDDYMGSIQRVGDRMLELADGRQLTAASLAVAAEVDHEGRLTRSGTLTPWIGQTPGRDAATILKLPPELVGSNNDAEVIAKSQYAINRQNGIVVEGATVTWSSGWGGALYDRSGRTYAKEPGHMDMRPGAECPCGVDGHVEGHISGNGILRNKGVPMEEWVRQPRAAEALVADAAYATSLFLNESRTGFNIKDFRWTGGVALGQPFLRRAVEEEVRAGYRHLGHDAPHFDAVTMGDQAGLHGLFVDAQRLARAA